MPYYLNGADLVVGAELPPLVLPPVDRTTLAIFGPASGDLNPIHIDIDFARGAGQPDVFAHGMLGMAWMGRVLTDWARLDRLRGFNARFNGITHLGNRITVTGTVAEIVEQGAENCARIKLANTTQYGQIKISGEALIALD